MNLESNDMSSDDFDRCKQIFLNNLAVTDEQRARIERDTVGQKNNDLWKQYKSQRLTASYFGRVCKLRSVDSRPKCVENILYDSFLGDRNTRYGINNEENARQQVGKTLGKQIHLSGLFIHKTLHYLGASPDGLVDEVDGDSILEITCPSSIQEYTPREAFENGKLKFMTENNEGQLVLKEEDKRYYQVQGELNISEKTYCYFVVWTPKGFIMDKIQRDESFWNDKIEPRVTEFYMNSLLPEMIDSRRARDLPIRASIVDQAV
ncbi:unnamed protein product [Aphis gossypii]|uniref:YqaJ viral recombinase domain-containing protein n=1 Tax=Aphis gossypii TaxID=80765 RepID=A0A9P0IM30_APHGO|nr:unnamed protein product [Aphis gossypii]